MISKIIYRLVRKYIKIEWHNSQVLSDPIIELFICGEKRLTIRGFASSKSNNPFTWVESKK